MSDTKWKNRIIFSGVKPASQFVVNPANIRKHPKKQQSLMRRILSKIGFINGVTENQTTGYLIDGHERVWEALKNGDEEVPYNVVNLTEKEEKLMLILYDQISKMAETDVDRLEEAVDDLRTSDILEEGVDDVIQDILDEMEKENHISNRKNPKSFEDISGELPGVQALKDFMIFPSPLAFGIPELLPDKILDLPEKTEVWVGNRGVYNDPDAYLYVWGSDSIKGLDLSKTVISFYTDDRRFESFWYDPSGYTGKLLNAGVRGVFMPNFSMFPEAPEAILVWQRYRSLWLARYFQEAGLEVLPDLRTVAKYGVFNYLGIPDGVPVAVQYQQGSIDYQKEIEETDKELDALSCPKVYIYADERGWKEFINYSSHADIAVWIHNRVSSKRNYMNEQRDKNPLRP